VNNGHTVQMTTDPGSTIAVGGKTYKLAQFHFHAPSEHTVDGQHFPLEIHLVHINEANQPAAVVGIMVKEGSANSVIDQPMNQLPSEEGKTTTFKGPFSLSALPSSSGGFWHYAGSLTTPPCTEGIQWFVMVNPIEMSPKEISEFASLPHMAETARPIQALGDRKLEILAR
jgi:carbonic anhydrase